METIKNIAAIIGCILSCISLITLCTKGGRTIIRNLFKTNTQDLHQENEQQQQDIAEIKENLTCVLSKLEALEAFSKQSCRDTIKEIYYRYCQEKRIPLYERKTADKTYILYTEQWNGNSYAKLLYDEICKWEIDSVNFQDLDEG